MKYIHLIPALIILIISSIMHAQNQTGGLMDLDKNMDVKKVDKYSHLNWYSPLDEPFHIYGFKWIKSDQVYRRLPKEKSPQLPVKVDRLANATSGGQIHFSTDSKEVHIRVELDGVGRKYHATPLQVMGFDCYEWVEGKQRFYSVGRFNPGDLTYTTRLSYNASRKQKEYTINFPLYNGVKKVEIGLVKGAKILESTHFKDKKSIVVYGTSITQGSAASRPGMSYTNILSRMLNREVVNLGFSGSGKGEPILAECINEIDDKALIILDFECNTHDALIDVLEPFIDTLRAKDKSTPILVVSRVHLLRDAQEKWQEKRKKLTDFQVNLVKKYKDNGDENIYFLDGLDLLDEKWKWEASIDGTHLTDLGFAMMAENMEPVIRKIINSK